MRQRSLLATWKRIAHTHLASHHFTLLVLLWITFPYPMPCNRAAKHLHSHKGKCIQLQDNPVTNKKVILIIFPSGTVPLPSLPHHWKKLKLAWCRRRCKARDSKELLRIYCNRDTTASSGKTIIKNMIDAKMKYCESLHSQLLLFFC